MRERGGAQEGTRGGATTITHRRHSSRIRLSTKTGLKNPAYASARDAEAEAASDSLPFGPSAQAGVRASAKRIHSRATGRLASGGPPESTTRLRREASVGASSTAAAGAAAAAAGAPAAGSAICSKWKVNVPLLKATSLRCRYGKWISDKRSPSRQGATARVEVTLGRAFFERVGGVPRMDGPKWIHSGHP